MKPLAAPRLRLTSYVMPLRLWTRGKDKVVEEFIFIFKLDGIVWTKNGSLLVDYEVAVLGS